MTEKLKNNGFSGMIMNGVYYLSGPIQQSTTKSAIEFILNASLDPNCNYEYISLIVNSPGGYLSDGFALIDVMMGCSIPVRTIGIGQISSMGLMIFLSGEKGTRTLTPNCEILSHQWSSEHSGKEHELVASQMGDRIATDRIMRLYKYTTGLSEKKIREKLLPPHDVWLTAKEAKDLGICDIVKSFKF